MVYSENVKKLLKKYVYENIKETKVLKTISSGDIGLRDKIDESVFESKLLSFEKKTLDVSYESD